MSEPIPTPVVGKMNYYNDTWDLRAAICPCDVQFVDWMSKKGIRDSTIFHFGTGSHHIVGIAAAEDGRNNCVLGITASPGEYDAFVRLAIDRPIVEKHCKAFFGDIYQIEPRLLPEFDVVTLFHLCEFRDERTDAYGGHTDRAVLDMLTEKTRSGGHILFYTKSFAFDTAEKILKVWEKEAGVEKVGMHDLLLVYRKK